MLRLALTALLVATAGPGIPAFPAGRTQSTAASVRLHHVHYRVPDPAATMNDTARALAGTRVVVSGLGVGVRVGSEFVLYDRMEQGGEPAAPQTPVTGAYDAAVAWLKTRGIAAAPSAFSESRLAHASPAAYDHLAFAAGEYEEVIARIGTAPVRRTSESAFFDTGSGLVEIVRDDGGPDAFWCPMHPDVRSGRPGECPVCRMGLMPIPPPKVGEYRLDVNLRPGVAGKTMIRLAVREPDTNALVRSFTTVHEKLFHLFIVSRDLEYFAHVHPDETEGGFELEHAVPPGEYMLIADFLPTGGTPQMVQRTVIVPRTGTKGATQPDRALRAPAPAARESVRVSLTTENLTAGREARLVFTVSEAKTGAPVTDLEPYLGAPAHMLIVRSDLSDAVHDHPHEQVTSGPTVSFHPLIPAPGDYKLWVQFQRGGTVFTFPFGFRVEQ